MIVKINGAVLARDIPAVADELGADDLSRPVRIGERFCQHQPVARHLGDRRGLEAAERLTHADGDRRAGAMDAEGRSFPAELLPRRLVSAGVAFALAGDDGDNAVRARGQRLDLPAGDWERVELLAAATDDVAAARFAVGDEPQAIGVQSWTGFVGQFDDRIWDRPMPKVDFRGEGKVIGQQAPDFTLMDLDGNLHTLSDQLGHPVVLAYFATW